MVCLSPRINFWMPEPIFVILGVYIMAPESVSLCVCMCIRPIVARQRLRNRVSAVTNTCNSRRIVGRVIFCAIRVLSKESVRVCLSPYRCLVTTRWTRYRGNE
jgi:hypothetical protein